jgi:membrane fusion protein, heavy metal efflux system
MHSTTHSSPELPGPETAAPATPKLVWGKLGGRAIPALIVVAVVVGGGYLLLGGQGPGARVAAKEGKKNEKKEEPAELGVSLVKGKPHTVEVPEDVRDCLGISHKGKPDMLVPAKVPTATKPLLLPGSTALDPTRLARIRARFAPCRVVELGQVADNRTGKSEIRELRPGDFVKKGEVLGTFYSDAIGNMKNNLLDALVQLILDQKVLDNAEAHRDAVPEVFMLNQIRAVQGDRNTISRTWNNLKAWDIPQEDIDQLLVEANKMAADKNSWLKTPEGKWVLGEKQAIVGGAVADLDKIKENPWGKVTLRAPFDGVIVERNLHVDEMVVDNTVNLFQVADVSRLLVNANAPEDDLPTLEGLGIRTPWTVRTAGVNSLEGIPGTIDEIGYLIDPNQHTAMIKGYVDNPGRKLRAGQYVAATVIIPPPPGVVEIPMNALVDDGRQSLVFVRLDPAKPYQYTMRRVQVTHRFDQRVFVRSTPIPEGDERLTKEEAEEGLLPKEPLLSGEIVLLTGAGELKAAVLSLESHQKEQQK